MKGESNNRLRLLESALQLFVAKGYDGVGVQEIVDAVGVTKPTLYHYFGSKIGILESIVAEYQEALLRPLTQAAEYRRDLTWNLLEIARVYFDFAASQGAFVRLNLAIWLGPEQSESRRVMMDFNLQQYRLLENLFRLATNDHGNMRGRHRPYALTFLGMVNNYISLSFHGLTPLDDDSLRRQAVHQFMHGIFS